MAVTIELSPSAQARLEAEAVRRGISIDELVAELVATLPADLPQRPNRKYSFIGIGASKSGRGARDADEMLAEGFGRD
jgi:hypothetical protein